MAVRTLSVSLDAETAASALAAAKAEGMTLSAWLSRAARRTATLESAQRAARDPIDDYLISRFEYEARHRLTAEVWETADATLDRLGLGLVSG
jgi:hypothetical protein